MEGKRDAFLIATESAVHPGLPRKNRSEGTGRRTGRFLRPVLRDRSSGKAKEPAFCRGPAGPKESVRRNRPENRPVPPAGPSRPVPPQKARPSRPIFRGKTAISCLLPCSVCGRKRSAEARNSLKELPLWLSSRDREEMH